MKLRIFLFLALLSVQGLLAQECFFTSASNVEATPFSNVCVKFNVHNFENIVAMQYTINWNEELLDFTGTTDYNLSGLGATNFGLSLIDQGVLTFSWADPGFVGSDLVDRTHIYSVCFDVADTLNVESAIDFTSSHTNIEVVDGNQSIIGFNKIPGNVEVRAIVNGGEKIRTGACIIDPSCQNGEMGSLRLSIEGGEDPLMVDWEGPDSFTSTSNDFATSTPGIYTVTVTDQVGFTRIDSFEILDLVPRLESQVVNDVRCFGQQNGSIGISIGQGTPPYSYNWSNGFTTQNISSLLPGSYSVIYTDSLGCSGSASFTIAEPDSIIVGEVSSICPSLGMSDGIASLVVQGGVLPYNFFWSDGNITNNGMQGNFAAGDHSVTVSDANNCPFITRTFTLETGIDSMQAEYFTCDGSDLPLVVYFSNVVSYDWSPADLLSCTTCPTPIVNTPNDTTILLTVTTGTGCSQSANLTITTADSCVWPGDTNNDGVANYLDLLLIGLANQATGPMRSSVSTNWLGQGAVNWTSSTPVSNVNYKYIDANGNGTINEQDIQAIEDNYASEHNFLPPDIWGQSRDDLPPFYIEIADTVEDNTLLSLDIIVGSPDKAIAQAHGLGFQIQFDETLVNVSDLSVAVEGWMGNNLWSIDRLSMTPGLLDVGITRSDLVGQSGQGKIGTLNISFNTVSGPLPGSLNIQNAYLINSDEGEIEVKTEIREFIIVEDLINAVNQIDGSAFKERLSPNPVSDILHISSERNIAQFEIYNLSGEMIDRNNLQGNQIALDKISMAGVYFIQLIGPDGTSRHKLIKL